MRVYIVRRPIHLGTVTFFKHQLGHPTYTTTLQIQGHFFFQIVGFKFGTQKIVVWKKNGGCGRTVNRLQNTRSQCVFSVRAHRSAKVEDASYLL